VRGKCSLAAGRAGGQPGRIALQSAGGQPGRMTLQLDCPHSRMVYDSANMARPPRIPVWLSADQPVIYFLTICELNRRRAWDNADFFGAFEKAVAKLLERRLWFVISAIVMPDHLHLLASPLAARDQEVGNLSGALKRWTRQTALKSVPEAEWDWEPGSFDRLLRREESAWEKWEYMRENPVRAGLVGDWRDWPWSIGIREPREYL